MFTWICPHCGHEVPPSSGACPYCADKEQTGALAAVEVAADGPTAMAPPLALMIAPPSGRVASHLRMLMVLWLAQGVLRVLSLIPGLLLWFPATMPPGIALGGGKFVSDPFPADRRRLGVPVGVYGLDGCLPAGGVGSAGSRTLGSHLHYRGERDLAVGFPTRNSAEHLHPLGPVA
jgi:hypothetical protein